MFDGDWRPIDNIKGYAPLDWMLREKEGNELLVRFDQKDLPSICYEHFRCETHEENSDLGLRIGWITLVHKGVEVLCVQTVNNHTGMYSSNCYHTVENIGVIVDKISNIVDKQFLWEERENCFYHLGS